MKNLKHLLCAGIVACSLYFNAFSASSSSEEHASLADTQEKAESMEDIEQRYQAAQQLLALPSGIPASSAGPAVLSDDNFKKRSERPEETVGEQPAKYQETGKATFGAPSSEQGYASLADTGENAENMQSLEERYQAAQHMQTLQGLSPASSAGQIYLSDDNLKKRSERPEETIGEQPAKFQRIIEDPREIVRALDRLARIKHRNAFFNALIQHQNPEDILDELEAFMRYSPNQEEIEELTAAPQYQEFLRSKQIKDVITDLFIRSVLTGNDQPLLILQALLQTSEQNPEMHSLLTRVVHTANSALSARKTPEKISKTQAVLEQLPEFEAFLENKLSKADFNIIHRLKPLLSNRLSNFASIPLIGKDAHGQTIFLDPYIAVTFSGTLRNLFLPELIQLTGFTHEPLEFTDWTQHSLEKIFLIAGDILHAHTTNTWSNQTIDAWINKGIFAGETPNTFKDLFEAAEFLDVAPVIMTVLNRGALDFARKRSQNFGALEILPKKVKKDIAQASHADSRRGAYINSLTEDVKNWRKQYPVSIAYLIQKGGIPAIINPENEPNERILHLDNRGIGKLTGLSDIPGIDTVTELNLSHNELKEIPAHAFVGLRNLKVLRLDYNQIETLAPETLNGLANLRNLSLRSNRITTIPDNFFIRLNRLRRLDLNNNRIQTVTPAALIGIGRLNNLSLSQNHLAAIPTPALSVVPNLHTLYLGSNHIETIPADAFNALVHLTELGLENNRLHAIDVNAFRGLGQLARLYLNTNPDLNSMAPAAIDPLLRIVFVNLAGTPLYDQQTRYDDVIRRNRRRAVQGEH